MLPGSSVSWGQGGVDSRRQQERSTQLLLPVHREPSQQNSLQGRLVPTLRVLLPRLEGKLQQELVAFTVDSQTA